MKKKLFLTLLAMVGIAMQVSAQWEKERSVTTVVLWAEDGTSAEYKCSDRPVVRHDGNELVLTVNGTELRISDTQSANFIVKEDLTGVKQVEKKGSVEVSQERISLADLKPGTEVMVYDTNGRQLLTAKAGEGQAQVNIGNLPHGIYVVKAGGINFKFLKR